MDQKLMQSFGELLRKQRKDCLEEFRRAEEDLEFIAEDRESEIEERAQEERSARLLSSMDDRKLHAVREIDAALHRIVDGKYGLCEACGKRIPTARLRALPATRFCKYCSRQEEAKGLISTEESSVKTKVPLPADLTLLNDSELAEMIVEHIREDGRIDLEELGILCRKGVVHLTGAIPGEVEHEILLQLLTDVIGVKRSSIRFGRKSSSGSGKVTKKERTL
jgi:RNA polymerase-binding transcription factor DksA